MGYNSYYLYRKVIQIGDQPPVPFYPETYSVSGDSENPMPLVLKEENSVECGYTDIVYRWHQLPISTASECSAGTKYYVDIYQVSYDGGLSWEDVVPTTTRIGDVYETGSSDCIEYRWVVSTGYVCSGTNKMTREIEEVSYDSGATWTSTGVERAAYPLIEADSPDCGYVPPTPIYRWVNMDISTDYVCDDCPEEQYRWTATTGYVCSGTNKMTREIEEVSYDSGTTWTPTGDERAALPVIEVDSTDCGYVPPTPQYRTLTTATTCINYDKYVLEEYQVSYDEGVTWTTTGTSATTLIEADSPDCGYPPTPTFNGKLKALYSDTSEYIVSCNTSTTLTQSEVRGHSTPYSSMTDAIIGDCVTSFVNPQPGYWSGGAFWGCSSLTSVTISDNVTSIDNYTFYHCSGITNCTISQNSNLTTIGILTFGDCSGLTSINIPSGVTSIGYGAFQNCNSLTNITIPSGVTSVGDEVFSNCSSLSSFTFEQGSQLTNLGVNMLVSDYNLTSIVIPSGVTSITGTFQDCSGLTSVTFEQGSQLKSIRQSAFYRCYSLRNIDIPNSVTEIGFGVFNECSGLTSVTIGSSVTSIGDFAFSGCSSLASVTIPNSVTSISASAFYNCSDLTSVIIGSGVTRINNSVFYNCSSLTSVTVNATTPPVLGTNVFTNTNNNLIIYVPAASVNAYKTATNWSNYSSRIRAIS